MRHTPRRVYLQVTDRCPVGCAHCGFDCSARGGQRMEDSLAQDFLDEFSRRYGRPSHVALTGGEPMLYPDITLRLAQLAAQKGSVVRLVTSGFWARDEFQTRTRTKQLVRAGVSGLWLSGGDLPRGLPKEGDLERLVDCACGLGLSVFLNFPYIHPLHPGMRGRGLCAVDEEVTCDLRTAQSHRRWAERLSTMGSPSLVSHGWARVWDQGRARQLMDGLGPELARRVRADLRLAECDGGGLVDDLLGLSCSGRVFEDERAGLTGQRSCAPEWWPGRVARSTP